MSKTVPFEYFGSKARSFDFINSKLPRTRQYIEPFGGAATLLLNRQPVPVETYNDLFDDIPHFFRVLRESPDELTAALRATPYSRAEYKHALEARSCGYPDCSDIERARLFFITMEQARSQRKSNCEASNWSSQIVGVRTRASDASTSTWKNKIDKHLPEVAGRLRDVQIESRDAIDVIGRHDRETATFYVDPPYVHTTRGSDDNYAFEMEEEDHRELADVLDGCCGYVAVSGYASDLYEDLYCEWYRYDEVDRFGSDDRATNQEVLWTNYDADELGGRKIGDWPEPTRKGKQLTLTGAIES